MSLHTMNEDRLRSSAQGQFQRMPTLLICKNSLLRAGINHILAGTCFEVMSDLQNHASELVAFGDTEPALCIVAEKQTADELVQIVRSVKAQSPHTHVVYFADEIEPKALVQAYKAGLSGLCSTAMGRDALIKALELVALGEVFIPTAIGLSMIEEASLNRQSAGIPGAMSPANDMSGVPNKLSGREAQILQCLMEGASNKIIARKLEVTEATVKVHVKAILRKVRAANRTQAAMWAREHMVVPPNNAITVPNG